MERPFYVAVEGPIGVGKTTLARLLSDALHTELLLEVFEENPFLPKFYQDRERYAFQTQIFFLLSRYRQQREVIPRVLQRRPLVSDYLFAKDRIFAHLNLRGDELAVYEQLHDALAERIPTPDLVVYLKASTDVLMERIAFRDRPYERNMPRDYIEALRRAYEAFFATYRDAPVLVVDTNGLNVVSNPEHRAYVIGRVRAALEEGLVERPLPGLMPEAPAQAPSPRPRDLRRLREIQAWVAAQAGEGDAMADFLRLAEAVGRLAKVLSDVLAAQERYRQPVGNVAEAQARAVEERASDLEGILVDLLDDVLRLVAACRVDLEAAWSRRAMAVPEMAVPDRRERAG